MMSCGLLCDRIPNEQQTQVKHGTNEVQLGRDDQLPRCHFARFIGVLLTLLSAILAVLSRIVANQTTELDQQKVWNKE